MEQAVLCLVPFIRRTNCEVIVEPSKDLLTSEANIIHIFALTVNIIVIGIDLRIVTFARRIIITDCVIWHNS